jgi:hypothetical protein
MKKKFYDPVSSIYLFVFTDGLDTQSVEKIIGKKSRHIPQVKPESPLQSPKYVWTTTTKWHYGEDVDFALEDFLFNGLPEIASGLAEMQKRGALLQLDWVIGVGDAGTEGFFPILSLSPKLVHELDKWRFDFQIHLDDQIDAEQVGIKL